MNKGFLEIFILYIAALAVYGIVICLRCLLPCNIIENLSPLLNDVEQCLTSAVTIGAIPADIGQTSRCMELFTCRSCLLTDLAQPCGRPGTDAY